MTSSRERFGARAETYVASTDHAVPAELALLVEAAAPEPAWAALDVATGGGHTALAFAPHVRWVVATDLTPEMVAAARRHLAGQSAGNVSFAAAAAEALPFPAASFDLVTCRIAPHHFRRVARFVAESGRVLRPGGVLVVQDHVLPDDEPTARWIDEFERDRDPSHVRAHSAREWRRILADAGFAVTAATEIDKHHDLAAWAARQDADADALLSALREAPPAVAQWLQPAGLAGADPTFVNRHLVIAGRLG